MSSQIFSEAVKRALASSAFFSYGSLMKPDVKRIPNHETRGVAPPLLETWALQRDDFETKLMEQYEMIKPGETRILVAATGVGKSTKLPLRLVNYGRNAGIVLLPRPILVASIVKYLRRAAPAMGYPDVLVDALRSCYIRTPPTGAAVYYSTAEDFLVRCQQDPEMLTRMNVGFIYLDEAHVNNSGYQFVRLLVGLQWFGSVKVFYGTATSLDVSLKLEGNFPGVRPIPHPSNEFTLDSPDASPVSSVLHYRNIVNRTLIFLPSDRHIELWSAYYDLSDITVLTFTTFDSTTKLDVINAKLERKMPLVILACDQLSTGITLSIDTVICCGYIQELKVDYNLPGASLVVRHVNAAERTQRMGRVNRHLPGVGHYNDVSLAKSSSDMDDTMALYVYMWARMFNISIKNPLVSQYEDLMGECSDQYVALMLCAKTIPLLVMSYMNDNGELYAGCEVVKHVFRSGEPIAFTDESIESSISKWKDFSTGPRTWLDAPVSFKSKVTYPEEWYALPAAVWYAYQNERTNIGISFDNASVVSALVDDSRTKQKIKNRRSVVTVADNTPRRAMSLITTRNNESPTAELFQLAGLMNTIQEDVQDVEPPMASRVPINYQKQRSVSSVTEEIPRVLPVQSWLQDVVEKKPRRRSRKSSSSGSSYDKMDIELVQIDPIKYKFYKLYPVDKSLLTEYVTCESVMDRDFNRYDQLIRLKVVFSSLKRDQASRQDEQNKYFLSVLRVHNNKVMEHLQLKSSGGRSYSVFDKMLGRESYDDSIVKDIDQSTNLLHSMKFEQFFVGIDKRTRHASVSSGDSVAFDKIQKLKLTVSYFYAVGDPTVEAKVIDLYKFVFPVYLGTRVIGSMLRVGHAAILPYHVFDKCRETFNDLIVHEDDTVDIAVLWNNEFVDRTLKFRGPVDTETVVLVGFHPRDGQPVSLGPAEILLVGDVWCIDKVLTHGYSGFALVSVVDTNVVGIYKGFYSANADGKQFAAFVPTNTFVTYVAKALN